MRITIQEMIDNLNNKNNVEQVIKNYRCMLQLYRDHAAFFALPFVDAELLKEKVFDKHQSFQKVEEEFTAHFHHAVDQICKHTPPEIRKQHESTLHLKEKIFETMRKEYEDALIELLQEAKSNDKPKMEKLKNFYARNENLCAFVALNAKTLRETAKAWQAQHPNFIHSFAMQQYLNQVAPTWQSSWQAQTALLFKPSPTQQRMQQPEAVKEENNCYSGMFYD